VQAEDVDCAFDADVDFAVDRGGDNEAECAAGGSAEEFV
jgi:hypothetical protein